MNALIPIETTRRIAPLLRHRRSSLVNGWLMMLMLMDADMAMEVQTIIRSVTKF